MEAISASVSPDLSTLEMCDPCIVAKHLSIKAGDCCCAARTVLNHYSDLKSCLKLLSYMWR